LEAGHGLSFVGTPCPHPQSGQAGIANRPVLAC
jgi:hypothetical protein